MSHPDNPQMTERHIWAVAYRDGSVFVEYPEPTTHNTFHHVRTDEVARLELVPNHWIGETGPSFVVPIPPGYRPIFFRQTSIEVNPNTGAEEGHTRYAVIGYSFRVGANPEKKFDGFNIQHLTYIPESHPERPIVLSDTRLETGG